MHGHDRDLFGLQIVQVLITGKGQGFQKVGHIVSKGCGHAEQGLEHRLIFSFEQSLIEAGNTDSQ